MYYFLLIILGGSLGNFFDRIYYFAVPDFIDFHIGQFHWFIFNVSDIFITLGVISMIVLELTDNKIEKISGMTINNFFSKLISKIKKEDSENLEINLQKNHDILSEVSKRHSSAYIVGFAAETSNVNDNANKKLNSKNLNMIISNDVSDKSIGFDSDDNEVHVITKNETIFLKKNKKIKIAREILHIIALNTKS